MEDQGCERGVQVYLKNYHKSLDYRSFQFKQADKKALSQQVSFPTQPGAPATESCRSRSLRRPELSAVKLPCSQPSLRVSSFSCLTRILPDDTDAPTCRAERVEQFFRRFLQVFMGFRQRDYEEIVRSVSAANMETDKDPEARTDSGENVADSTAGDKEDGAAGHGGLMDVDEEKGSSKEAIFDESSMDVEEFESSRTSLRRQDRVTANENGKPSARSEKRNAEQQVVDVLEDVLKAVSGEPSWAEKQLTSIQDLDVAMLRVVKQAAEAVSKGTDASVDRTMFPSPTSFFEPELESKKEGGSRSTRESRSKTRAQEFAVNESDADYSSSYKPPVDSYQAPTYVPPVAEEEKEEEKVKDVCKEDIWQTVYTFPDFSPVSLLQEGSSEKPRSQLDGGDLEQTGIFYGNLKCYYFFRLYQKMYERLSKAKELAQTQDDRLRKDEEEKAEELLRKAMSSQDVAEDVDAGGGELGSAKGSPGFTYKTFMDMVARLVKGSLDSADFEEGCRVTLGTSSYEVFTLEWLSDQLLRLARALAGEDARSPNGGSCFVSLFEYQHLQNGCFGPVYEANARRLAGSSDCYAFFYDRTVSALSISLHLVESPESKDLREREKSDRVQSPSDEDHADEAEDEAKAPATWMARSLRAGRKALRDVLQGVYERNELVVQHEGTEQPEFEAHSSDGMWRSKGARSNRKQYNIQRRSEKMRKWQEEGHERIVAQQQEKARKKEKVESKANAESLAEFLDTYSLSYEMQREQRTQRQRYRKELESLLEASVAEQVGEENVASIPNSSAGTPHRTREEEEEGEKKEEEEEEKKEEEDGQDGPVTRKRRLNLQGEESRSVSASPAPKERRRIVFVCRKSDELAQEEAARKAAEMASGSREQEAAIQRGAEEEGRKEASVEEAKDKGVLEEEDGAGEEEEALVAEEERGGGAEGKHDGEVEEEEVGAGDDDEEEEPGAEGETLRREESPTQASRKRSTSEPLEDEGTAEVEAKELAVASKAAKRSEKDSP
eukprot:748174-Hanusia_phi.AAC.1